LSHFLCGELDFATDLTWPELNTVAFLFAREALGNNLSVSLGSNIPQAIVFEILGRRRNDPIAHAVPFLMTSSPALDTSDDVVCPDFFDRGLEAGYADLRTQLQKVSATLEKLFQVQPLRQITLTFSEGFSPDYRPASATCADFVDVCLDLYRRQNAASGMQDIVVPLIRIQLAR
jgi:hypothetical protein